MNNNEKIQTSFKIEKELHKRVKAIASFKCEKVTEIYTKFAEQYIEENSHILEHLDIR